MKNVIIPGMLFENMGFTYLGPIDGHDVKEMCLQIEYAKKVQGPVILHVLTQKGKGYMPAEKSPEKDHGVGKLSPKTTQECNTDQVGYSHIFGDTMIKLAEENPMITCFTAAMPAGTGLDQYAKIYPDRFIDVGIAEQNAITMAGGMATMGLRPVVAVYSTFLQRAYDQLLHDIALQDLPVTFAIDRAGIVGHDGETHHGIYDLSYLLHIPNMHILAPSNGDELEAMLSVATSEINHPVAIRYPRGKSRVTHDNIENVLEPELICAGDDIAIVAVGSMVENAKAAAKILQDEGLSVCLINARRVKPLNIDLYKELLEGNTIEENVVIGGFGAYFTQQLQTSMASVQVVNIGVEDKIIHHGNQKQLQKVAGLDPLSLASKIKTALRGE